MGIEQGTPASGSIIELPPIADLTDPRLPRAFNSWIQFSQGRCQQVGRIDLLQPAEVVSLAGELSNTISRAIGVDRNSSGSISEDKLVQLVDIVSGTGNRVIFMRHGEQSPPEWVSSLVNPALRKIRMMQDPFNRQDLLTNNGLVDVFVTALALLYVQASTGRRTRIFSSENLRAKEAAYIISVVMSSSRVSMLEGLNCITYRDETDDPPLAIEQLLEELPSGAIPWNPKLIDRLCKKNKSGLGYSEVIISAIKDLIEKSKNKGNDSFLVLTHTQQLAEVLRLKGGLVDPFMRFPELTMLILGENNLYISSRGILPETIEQENI